MPLPLRPKRHQGTLGSLNDGKALPELGIDELADAWNIEHASDGSVGVRPGHETLGEIASVPEPTCLPVVEGVEDDEDGELIPRLYTVRYTYATAAGETDDLHSSVAGTQWRLGELIEAELFDEGAFPSKDIYTGTLLNTPIQPGSVFVTIGNINGRDDGEGLITGDIEISGGIDYETGDIEVNVAVPQVDVDAYVTYRIDPGESAVGCPLEHEIELVGDENAIRVRVPMHVRDALITSASVYTATGDGGVIEGDQGDPPVLVDPLDCESGALVPPADEVIEGFEDVELEPNQRVTILTVEGGLPAACDNQTLVGWLVYSRSPAVQDETHLGVNCANDPLYHRRSALGAVVASNIVTGQIMISGAHDIGNAEDTARNTVDIMMPDRGSLPILHANAYISQDGINFFYAGQIHDGQGHLIIREYDDTKTRAPSTRIDRSAPDVEDVEAVLDPLGGCPEQPARSRIRGGLYALRYTWTMEDESYMADPGLADFMEAAEWGEGVPAHRYPQESWPSCRAVIGINDDRAIKITPPEKPVGVSGWNAYSEKLEPATTLTFEGSLRNPDQTGGGTPVGRQVAFFFGHTDRTDPQVETGILAGALDLSPTSMLPSIYWDEFADGSALIINSEDPLDATHPIPASKGYRPGYEDIRREVDDSTDEILPLFATARPSVTAGGMMFFFNIEDDDLALSTDAVFTLKVRWRPNNTSYSPASKGKTWIRVWNQNSLSWETLVTGTTLERGPYTVDDCWTFVEHRLHVAAPLGKLFSWGGFQHLIFSIKTTNSVAFDVRDVQLELYREPRPQTCYPCHPASGLTSVGTQEYDYQDSAFHGTDPRRVVFLNSTDTAVYSGDAAESDAAVNAGVTEAVVLTGAPLTKWDPAGSSYKEYADTSSFATSGLDPELLTSRGWPPSYDDVRPHRFTYGSRRTNFLYGSSRDGSAASIANNEHLFWFWLPDAGLGAEEQYTCGVLHVRMRTRAGGASFNPADGAQRQIRVWDAGAAAWSELQSQIPTTNDFRWYDNRFTYSGASLVRQQIGGVWYAWLVFDVAAIHHNGFDIDNIWLELYPNKTLEGSGCDTYPGEDVVCQRAGVTDLDYTLQNELVERPRLTDGTVLHPQGEWMSIRSNTTAQWPVLVASLPTVGDVGVSSERMVDMVAAADSIFTLGPDGRMTRVFQIEGERWVHCLKHDWRFSNYLWRTFFCNPGENRWNYRYDGEQTYPMGLPIPAANDEETDRHGNYIWPTPPGGSDLSGEPTSLIEDIFHDPLGEITYIVMPDEGDDGVTYWDAEYYLVYKRVLTILGRSYVVRSSPRLLTETTMVFGSDAFTPRLVIEADLCPEPQATHLEIYRNMANTAKYFLVGEIPIDEGLERNDDGTIHLLFEDEIELSDEDLTIPMFRKTGRPTPAVMMSSFHRGRIFFIQQEERELIAFTNVGSPSGALDPEGFFPLHVIEPPMRQASAITSFSPYHSALLAHSDNGIVAIEGTSDESDDPGAISAEPLVADSGAMGPDAWVTVDNVLYLMTRKGPAIVLGDELKYIGTQVEGTIGKAALSTENGWNIRLVQYRTKGKAQVIMTYPDNAHGWMRTALVFDQEVANPADARMYWKRWRDLPCHGMTVSEDTDGVEFVIFGGPKGRLFRHDQAGTDAGLFIEFDLSTGAFVEGSAGASFQPALIYFQNAGESCDSFCMDLRRDYESIAANPAPIPIEASGSIRFEEDSDGDYPWPAHWSTDKPGWDYPGYNWPTHERPYAERRANLSGIFRQLQIRLYRTHETWPPGAPRSATFETSGYTLFIRVFGERGASK